MIGRFLYTISIYLLGFVIRILAIFKPQVKKWVSGRKNWEETLRLQLVEKIAGHEEVVWLHAASTGEFEQGKPILEALKNQYPGIKIVVSFFSPSGFEASQNSNLADIVCYLPLDTPSQAECFISMLRPKLVLWVKYEYWWNHLAFIKKKNIPLLLVSAILQNRHPANKWYGGWYRQMLGLFNHIFVQDEGTASILRLIIPGEKITSAGDTRFDRVIAIEKKWSPLPMIEGWIGNTEIVIVAGSTWLEDIQLLQPSIQKRKDIKWIIVPHKIDDKSLSDSLQILPKYIKFSDLEKNNYGVDSGINVLIIDAMGFLSKLYKYATLCYIGGGFTPTGIHNSLEAAVYGKPLIWGPRYNRYVEAMDLVNCKAAFSVRENDELEKNLDLLLNDLTTYKKSSADASKYVLEKAGATQKVLNFIYKNRLLTSE